MLDLLELILVSRGSLNLHPFCSSAKVAIAPLHNVWVCLSSSRESIIPLNLLWIWLKWCLKIFAAVLWSSLKWVIHRGIELPCHSGLSICGRQSAHISGPPQIGWRDVCKCYLGPSTHCIYYATMLIKILIFYSEVATVSVCFNTCLWWLISFIIKDLLKELMIRVGKLRKSGGQNKV